MFLGDHTANNADMRAKGRADSWGAKRRRERTHCKRNHPRIPENLRTDAQGYPVCTQCERDAYQRCKLDNASSSGRVAHVDTRLGNPGSPTIWRYGR